MKTRAPPGRLTPRSSQWVTSGDTGVPELEQGTGLRVVGGRLSHRVPDTLKLSINFQKNSQEQVGLGCLRLLPGGSWKLRPGEVRAAGPTGSESSCGRVDVRCDAHSQGHNQHQGDAKVLTSAQAFLGQGRLASLPC